MKKRFPLFVGADIGTQGTKSVVCDVDGNIIGEGFAPSSLVYSDNGGVWEAAEGILAGVVASLKKAVSVAGVNPRDVAALSFDSQMAGLMAIDKDFNAVLPLDSWLDERCAPYTDELREKLGDDAILKSGGQFVHSHASRMLRLKRECPELYEKTAKFIQPNAFVAGKICDLKAEQAFIDYTFLHFNVFSDNLNKRIDGDKLALLGISEDKMPKIVSPFDEAGKTSKTFEEETGISEGTPVFAGCGDTAASALGSGITRKGLAYDVAGTASVFACCTEKFEPDVKNKTLLYARSAIDGLYTPLSYVSGGGLCLKWFSEITGAGYDVLDKEAENAKAAEEGLFFIPHFSGRSFPLDDGMRGGFVGITQKTTRGAMYRAIMEALAFEYRIYSDILASCGAIDNISAVYGVGGGAKSRVFSKIKADILNAEYRALKIADSAPRAAAVIAASGAGFLNEPIAEFFSPERIKAESFMPDGKRYSGLEKEYLNAAECSYRQKRFERR
ncbi:MAG: FGGY family carbohydrate kinase [bacterium]|nr:FGGY family carbohydrate kinase [bacterium]